MSRLLAVFAFALVALGQQPEVEKFYEELIRTPLVPQRSRDDIRADRKATEQQLRQLNNTVADYQARVNEASGLGTRPWRRRARRPRRRSEKQTSSRSRRSVSSYSSSKTT